MALRYIAFYLPQFYPFPENDLWWGKGFTEWTNVTKAQPLFDGHDQPHLPTDLGFYDLRLRETQHEQIALAREYGIDAFCFHYYWFDGKRLLDKPVDAFLADHEADLPFCLCWANENWTRRWDAAEQEVLIAQSYGPGWEARFADSLVPFFKDPRYVRVDGRPVLVVYRPQHIPDARQAAERWREHCRKAGVGEIHIVCALTHGNDDYKQYGFDAGVEFPPHNMRIKGVNEIVPAYQPYNGHAVEFSDVARDYLGRDHRARRIYRTVFPSWDNTARVKDRALIVLGATVSNYERWLRGASSLTKSDRRDSEQLVFINAWNEWAEGCHLEPDRKFGRGFLEATSRVKRGVSMVDDVYDIHPLRRLHDQKSNHVQLEAPIALPVADAQKPVATLPFKWKVVARLHDRPLALGFARLVYRTSKRVAKPIRAWIARLKERQKSGDLSARNEETFSRLLSEVSLDDLEDEVSSRDEFLSAKRDVVWTAYPVSTVVAQISPTLTVAAGTKNGDGMRRMLQEESFEAFPFKFGRFFNCLAHPRSVSVVTSDGKLITESMRVYRFVDPTLTKLNYLKEEDGKQFQTAQASGYIEEDVLIPVHASIAFGHCLFDAIPQILIFENEIKQGKIKVVLPDCVPSWFQGILSSWDFLPHHFLILPTFPSKVFRFKSAIISNALTTYTTFYPNPKMFERYRQGIASTPLKKPKGNASKSVVYLTRKAESTYSGRVIENDQELVRALERVGGVIADPASMTYQDQIELFRSADVIVGAHGSAFANLVWCRPGTQVIDLMPDDWVGFWGSADGVTELWVQRICALNALQYDAILCESRGAEGKWEDGASYSMRSRVDIDLVIKKAGFILSE